MRPLIVVVLVTFACADEAEPTGTSTEALCVHQLTCDGKDPTYAAGDQRLEQVWQWGRKITLHWSPPDEMAWATIENGVLGDEVWLDRSFDGGQSWAPKLGDTTIPFGWNSWRTLMYSSVNALLGRGQLRACGKAGDRPEITCTAWLPVCGTICDGRDPAIARGERAVEQSPLAFVWWRTIQLHMADDDAAAWVSLAGAPGDEMWIDRSWDGGATWNGQIGYTTIPAGATGWRSLMFAFDDPAHGGTGSLRACGKAGDRDLIQCTPWVRAGDHPADPRDEALGALVASYDPTLRLWIGRDGGGQASPVWWQSANAITELVDAMDRDGSCRFWPLVNDVFEHADNGNKSFQNDYYDDTMWWALAWLRAFEASAGRCGISDARRIEFFTTALNAYEYATQGKAGFFDAPLCIGLLLWQPSSPFHQPHVITITNALYLKLAARLYSAWESIAPGDPFAGVLLDDAESFWSQLSPHLARTSDGVLLDGLIVPGADPYDPASFCTYNAYSTGVFTYNEGAVVGALAALARATGNAAFLDEADAMANAILVHHTRGGILFEPGSDDSIPAQFGVATLAACETANDGMMFKGIFVRNLRDLVDADVAFGRPVAQFTGMLAAQASALSARDRSGWGEHGFFWNGPIRNTCDIGPVNQISAVGAFNAAFALPQ